MAWSFRKKIKVAPGVNINLSKSGMSTSFGPKGAKMTVGPKGTYIHTSIPGTGLYSRRKLSSNQQNTGSQGSSFSALRDNDGRVFQGCLLSWPRFLLWAAIIYLLYLSITRVHTRVIYGWELVLYSLLIIGGLIVLWRINGGSFYDRVPKRRFFDILWFATIVVGILIAVYHSSKTSADTQDIPESSIVEPNTSTQEENVPELVIESHHITEGGLLASLYVVFGLLITTIVIVGIQTRSKKLLQNIERFLPIDIIDSETGEVYALEKFSNILPDQDDRMIETAQFVVFCQNCSASEIQKNLGLGYAKAGHIIEQLKKVGIVSQSNGVLIKSIEELNSFLIHLLLSPSSEGVNS